MRTHEHRSMTAGTGDVPAPCVIERFIGRLAVRKPAGVLLFPKSDLEEARNANP